MDYRTIGLADERVRIRVRLRLGLGVRYRPLVRQSDACNPWGRRIESQKQACVKPALLGDKQHYVGLCGENIFLACHNKPHNVVLWPAIIYSVYSALIIQMVFVVVETAVGLVCIAVILILFCFSLLVWEMKRDKNDAIRRLRRVNSGKQLYIYLCQTPCKIQLSLVYILDQELISYRYLSYFFLLGGSVVSNRIGMKFCRNVFLLNIHRFTQAWSDFRLDVTVPSRAVLILLRTQGPSG